MSSSSDSSSSSSGSETEEEIVEFSGIVPYNESEDSEDSFHTGCRNVSH